MQFCWDGGFHWINCIDLIWGASFIRGMWVFFHLYLYFRSLLYLYFFFWLEWGENCDIWECGELERVKAECFSSRIWNSVENERELLQEPNGDIDMCVWKSKLSKV